MRSGRSLAATATVVAAAIVLLAACGGEGGTAVRPAAAPVPTIERRQVDVDGAPRSYRLFTPLLPDGGPPPPLVLALHGSGNTGENFAEATQLDRSAEANGFVVAYPDAIRTLWNGGFCCNFGRAPTSVDVGFLERLIDDVAASRGIDTNRVYAIGVSAGGVMAYRLACDLAGRVAGVASVAGAMQLDDCRPSRPVSVIAVHGTADEVVPYTGGKVIGAATLPAPPTAAVAERWASLDGCPGPARTTTEGPVTTADWSGCSAGTKVRLVTVDGGGHTWYAREFGPPNGAVDATAAVVGFLGLSLRR